MNQSVKIKKSVFWLSLVSLIFAVLQSSVFFMDLKYTSPGPSPVLTFRLPTLAGFISFLLEIAIPTLWFIYVFKFHGSNNGRWFLPVIFGLIAFNELYGSNFNFLLRKIESIEFFFHINNIRVLVFAVAFILAAISAVKGAHQKLFFIIASSVGLLVVLLHLVNSINSLVFIFTHGLHVFSVASPAWLLAKATLYISLLLFSLKSLKSEANKQITENEPNI